MSSKNIELIKQALSAAEGSIKLAKQLLSEMENGKALPEGPSKVVGEDLPGVVGIFDGENMVSETGETFPVPANYASKSLLVVGDTLKLVEEGKNKDKRFKQIEHVKRHKSMGILTKKDGKWKVVTPEGSYKVLGAAVEHFGADIGAEVTLHLPASNLTVAYGAIESAKKVAKEVAEEETVEKKPEEIKTEPSTNNVSPKDNDKEVKVENMPEPKQEKTEPEPKKPEPKKEPVETKPAPVVKKEPLPKKEEVKEVEVKVETPIKEEKPVQPAEPKSVPAPEPEPAPAAVETPVKNSPMEVSSEEEELT